MILLSFADQLKTEMGKYAEDSQYFSNLLIYKIHCQNVFEKE